MQETTTQIFQYNHVVAAENNNK